MKFVLFGGGLAGRLAAEALTKSFPRQIVGVVWDATAEAPPKHLGVPILTQENAFGVADMLLCSGYGQILQAALLTSFKGGGYNAHPSLLPSYRGRHPIQWAIASGESVLGVSLHEMTKVIDEGRVFLIRCRRFAITESYPGIAACLAGMAAEMLVEFVALADHSGLPQPLPVDPRVDRYYRRRVAADNQIDWTRSSSEIINSIRATGTAYPATSQDKDGSRITVAGYKVGTTPGEVLVVADGGCLVATGDGTIWIEFENPPVIGDILR